MRRLIPAAAVLVLAAAGCRFEKTDRTPGRKERVRRLALFADVEKLAVAPFRDEGGAPGMDAVLFARLFADELVRLRRFRLIFPGQVAAAAAEANRELAGRARAEQRAPAADEIIDLARSETDVVAAARAAGADAVLTCTVHDFEVYPPKRLALTVRVYLCRQARRSFREIIAQTSAGVPLEVPGELRERFIWERQRHYDSGRKGTRTGMGWHARKHEPTRAFGSEIFYYSTEKFLAFVASELSAKLYSDSLWHRSRARIRRLAADRRGKDALHGAGGSGFKPGHGERGTERRRR